MIHKQMKQLQGERKRKAPWPMETLLRKGPRKSLNSNSPVRK